MGRLNTSTSLLSSYFLTQVRKLKTTDDGKADTSSGYKISVIQDFESILRKGLDYAEIQSIMDKITSSNFYSPWDMLNPIWAEELKATPDVYPKAPDELVYYTLFYYHPLLQETRKPAGFSYNEETGEVIEAVREPYFLEIVDSFTMRDLVDYFMTQMELVGTMEDRPSKRKGLATEFYKINNYSLDMLLYLIDSARIECELEDKRKPRFVGSLLEYSEKAEQLFKSRRDILNERGGNKIVPRSGTNYRTNAVH